MIKRNVHCASLYYCSPGYFQFLTQTLDQSLPSKATLIRWQPFKSLSIGVIPEVVSYLKEIRNTLDEDSAKIILTLDEMDGRRGLMYDQARECLVGFECLAQKTTNIAINFLTVMIRGLNGKLENIIIANFATSNGITGDQESLLLPMIIRILRDINDDVVATVMDQSGVNRKAYSLFGATVEEPFFFVDGVQVFALFDYPHLFKSMRTTALEGAMELSDGKISGEIIKNAYLLDKKAST